MRECRTYGSVRGAARKGGSYRNLCNFVAIRQSLAIRSLLHRTFATYHFYLKRTT